MTGMPVAAEPARGGGVVIGEWWSPSTLNPYAPGGDAFAVARIAQALHTGVSDVDATTLELIPEVVDALPTVDNGGIVVNDDATMTVRYRIREEARWADGVPISGDDFAFTYRVVVDSAAERTDTPYELINPDSLVIGPKSFEYTMNAPTLLHENLFRYLIPRHEVEGTDFLGDWNQEPWVSGGPFEFASWIRGESLTLTRNDDYWKVDEDGEQLPYLDRVEFRFGPADGGHTGFDTEDALVRSFTSGDLDVINPAPFLGFFNRIEAAGADLQVRRSPIWEHLNFQFGENNRNPDSMNEHVLFRRAVAHALDRDRLAEDIHKTYGRRMDSYLEVYTPALSAGAWSRYGYDPDTAGRLLQQLCVELRRDCGADPLRAVFSTTSNGDVRVRLADLFKEMLAEVGIELELDLEDSARYFGATLDKGDWDLGLWAWVGTPGLAPLVQMLDVVDPDGPPPDGYNVYRWGTPEVSGADLLDTFYSADELRLDPNQGPSRVVDEHTARFVELVDEARATVDGERLRTLIQEAEEILADQVVIIPLFARLDAGAYWPDRIAGYLHNPSYAGDTWNIERWFRVDG